MSPTNSKHHPGGEANSKTDLGPSGQSRRKTQDEAQRARAERWPDELEIREPDARRNGEPRVGATETKGQEERMGSQKMNNSNNMRITKINYVYVF